MQLTGLTHVHPQQVERRTFASAASLTKETVSCTRHVRELTRTSVLKQLVVTVRQWRDGAALLGQMASELSGQGDECPGEVDVWVTELTRTSFGRSGVLLASRGFQTTRCESWRRAIEPDTARSESELTYLARSSSAQRRAVALASAACGIHQVRWS